jgi:Ca2+-binding RTX toxin-like protein
VLNGGAGNDYLFGDDGVDELNGGSGIDRIWGGAGIDTINGDDGNDYLYGEGDADLIDGGTGNDYIRGGDGGDFITGGVGNDSMYGEAGADTFIFNATDTGADYIWDFTEASDVLRFDGLTASDLTGITNGNGNALITIVPSGATVQVRGVSWDDIQDDFAFVIDHV